MTLHLVHEPSTPGLDGALAACVTIPPGLARSAEGTVERRTNKKGTNPIVTISG